MALKLQQNAAIMRMRQKDQLQFKDEISSKTAKLLTGIQLTGHWIKFG